MGNSTNEFSKSRPQRLCHMCGKCCRVVVAATVTPKTYEELKSIADAGDESAIDFLRVFEPYSSVEDARKVSKETVENILLALDEAGTYDEKNVTFYKCKYLMDNNLCGIYENRPQLCDNFPVSCWAVVPPGCGFEGWLFQKREERKQKIRKFKENILSLETTMKELEADGEFEQIKKVEDIIEKLTKTISLYDKYGAQDW